MLLNIGNLAKAYGVLPSYVLEHGTTFDLMVADVMVAWENFQKNPQDSDQYKTEDLQKVLEQVR